MARRSDRKRQEVRRYQEVQADGELEAGVRRAIVNSLRDEKKGPMPPPDLPEPSEESDGGVADQNQNDDAPDPHQTSDSESSGDDPDTEWHDVDDVTVERPHYVGPVGPRAKRPEDIDSELDAFFMVFPPALLNYITVETNRYARFIREHKTGRRRKQDIEVQPWKDLTAYELAAFFGCCLRMGIISVPELHDYWNHADSLAQPSITSIFPRDRFVEIMSGLHFVNNEEKLDFDDPEFDKLWKVRPVVQYLREAFREAMFAGGNLTVDESRQAFKGASSATQFNQSKPVKTVPLSNQSDDFITACLF